MFAQKNPATSTVDMSSQLARQLVGSPPITAKQSQIHHQNPSSVRSGYSIINFFFFFLKWCNVANTNWLFFYINYTIGKDYFLEGKRGFLYWLCG